MAQFFQDFGSSGALNEIFEFREQDFWIPRQILYGNDDFEDFCEWLNFLKILAPHELLMRFLSFGTNLDDEMTYL